MKWTPFCRTKSGKGVFNVADNTIIISRGKSKYIAMQIIALRGITVYGNTIFQFLMDGIALMDYMSFKAILILV